MVRTTMKLLGYPIAAAVAGAVLATAAIVVPAAPAQAQYWGYYPPYAYPYYAYPYPAYYPPSWSYSPYDSPFGYTLNDPSYPCVWEGKGCPTGR